LNFRIKNLCSLCKEKIEKLDDNIDNYDFEIKENLKCSYSCNQKIYDCI
jgi:hypothetical protein